MGLERKGRKQRRRDEWSLGMVEGKEGRRNRTARDEAGTERKTQKQPTNKTE
jgi:hypothetical protein